MPTSSQGLTLGGLPAPVRLVIAVFLISVGVGYCSALVQCISSTAPGKLLPGPEDAVATYYGQERMSVLGELLTADEGKPFNGSGTMRVAFTTKSAGWLRAIRKKTEEHHLDSAQAEAELYREREGERLAS